jgi:nucleoside-diphosphate-sugar epimerase
MSVEVLVTGGAGFLGQQLIRALLARPALRIDDAGPAQPIGRIVCFDVAEGALRDPRVRNVAGDIADAAQVRALVGPDTRLVVHLAAVVSGTAEADFDLGMRVNLDGTRHVLEACRALGNAPRVLFSSSLAVFGGEVPAVVTDATTPTPQGSYGIQKLIGEHLVQDYSRKGFIDGRSLRLPTVVVRPGRPNGAASGFASGIIREPLAGVPAVLPVEPATEMWLASPRAIVAMLLHAAELPASAWGWYRSLNLPGFVARMDDEIAALRKLAGDAVVALIRHEPDERVMRLVKSWPPRFDTARARAMGFEGDRDFESIVRAYIEDNRDAVKVPVRT